MAHAYECLIITKWQYLIGLEDEEEVLEKVSHHGEWAVKFQRA